MSTLPSPPLLARILTSCIRGRGAEFLKGDLAEAWIRNSDQPTSYTWMILKSVLSWYRPGAVLRRARLASGSNKGARNALLRSPDPGHGEWFFGAARDLRLACRTLLRRPGFSLVTIAVMATGLGATVTVYTIADHVLLRPLPLPEAHRLVSVGTTFPGREFREGAKDLQHLAGFSMANYRDWHERSRSFEHLAALEPISVLLDDPDQGPILAQAARVDAPFFEIMDVEPALGRVFTANEYLASSAEGLALLSYDTWKTRFGGDPDLIGQQIPNAPQPTTIIGVLPQGFTPPEATVARSTEFWLPLQADHDRYENRGRRSLIGIGRLADGVTLERARADMAAVAEGLARDFPDGNVSSRGAFGAGVNWLHAETVGTAGASLTIFLGAAILLLAVAGLNTANLFLVRGLNRGREVAVRLALGAGSVRMVRYVLAETLLLALIGGSVGVALAHTGVRLFRSYGPPSLPRLHEIAVDGRILFAALFLTILCGIVTGLLPALRTAQKRSSYSGSGARTLGRNSRRFWWTLVGGQVAFSLVILVGASLLLQTFLNLRAYNPGFDPSQALTFRQPIKNGAGTPAYQDWDAAVEGVAGVPGVSAVAGMSNLPFQDPNWAPRVLLPGEDPETTVREGVAGYVVTSNYTEVMGVAVTRGRGFTQLDGPDGEQVALVNEAFVRRELRTTDPVGALLLLSAEEGFREVRVVGVVANVVQRSADQGEQPAVYFPYRQIEWPGLWLFARTVVDPSEVTGPVRQAIARALPGQPTLSMASMTDRISRTRTTARFNALLFLSFAVAALVLSGTGLFGALSYLVHQRTREIGLRMALGAETSAVVGMVVRQGLLVTIAGVACGLSLSLVATRWIGSFLFGVPALDAMTFSVAAASLCLSALVATIGPAWSAVRTAPSISLGAPD